MCAVLLPPGDNPLAVNKYINININKNTRFWWGNLRERDHWGGPGIDGRIILRRIFRKWDVGVWTGSSWLRIVTVGGQL